MIPDGGAFTALQARMQAAARAFRLPLRNRTWRGLHGNWAGAGTGSSIDFQDHRPYLPGDDPRYIDWQAYARSGHYTMKLYREEVSPSIDLALDVSPSLFLNPAKTERTLELFYFAAAGAIAARGALRCYFVSAEAVVPVAAQAVMARETLADAVRAAGAERTAAPPRLERVPWRSGSLRVWISDLLFPGAPSVEPLAAARGRGVVFAPWCLAESEPDWEGNRELIDCESGARRTQRIDAGLMERYRESYLRHFSLWREQARRHGVAFARVPAEPRFSEALGAEALPNGAVEPA